MGVAHLEYVFSPSGLPLPFKGERDIGTTSILVRGGAGTGKTTLALALAHSIARESEGSALVLTTEFSPVEISFKASVLGLSESIVQRWPGRSPVESGAILVEHLTQVGGGEQILSSAERRSRSIDAVWDLLHPTSSGDSSELEQEDPARCPVRVVVIDALTLPEAGSADGAQRADLVAFVQALEADGCSVILVEELADGVHAWSTFVVDVVFELSLAPHAEAGELRRKLTVSKSRYSVSTPGPHDYGLRGGKPATWPNLLRVVAGSPSREISVLRQMEPLPLWVPAPVENHWLEITSRVVLTQHHSDGDQALRVLERTSGAKIVFVHCGVNATISFGQTQVRVFDHEGVQAIVWAVASCRGANVCHVTGMSGLIAREGAVRASHLLSGLSGLGYLVCVYEPQPESITPTIRSMADFLWLGAANGRLVSPQPRLSFCLSQSMGRPYREDWKREDRLPWFYYLRGNTWRAGLAALHAVSRVEPPPPSTQVLWDALCAELAGSRDAVLRLKEGILGDHEKLAIDPLCRALVRDEKLKEMEELVAEFFSDAPLPPWMTVRVLAEARLASPKRAILLEAALNLEALAQVANLPEQARGEICFNISCAYAQLGNSAKAFNWKKRAREFYPNIYSDDPSAY